MFKALNISPNISESMVESSLSTISDIVNQTSSPGEKGMASVDIVQSVNLIAKISQKNITFTDQKAAEKTAEVRHLAYIFLSHTSLILFLWKVWLYAVFIIKFMHRYMVSIYSSFAYLKL